jgi:hypothetical protein
MRVEFLLNKLSELIASHHLVNSNLMERSELPSLWVPLPDEHSVSLVSDPAVMLEELLVQVDFLNVEVFSVVKE